MRRGGAGVLLLVGLLALAGVAPAAGEAVPDPGLLRGDRFVPDLDAVCGSGTRIGQGCDAIRARDIVDAAQAPWSAVGRVNFASTQVRQHCTGVLVSPRLVLTASHCLYSYARKVWIPSGSVRFVAGYQRGAFVASAGVARYILDPVHDPTSRDFRAGPAQDWALLVLDAPIDGVIYPEVPETEPEGESVLAGYAGLRSHVLSVAKDCGAASEMPGDILLLMRCSAMPGDSGAPLLVESDGALQVAGVFVGGIRDGAEIRSIVIPVRAFAGALKAALAE